MHECKRSYVKENVDIAGSSVQKPNTDYASRIFIEHGNRQ